NRRRVDADDAIAGLETCRLGRRALGDFRRNRAHDGPRAETETLEERLLLGQLARTAFEVEANVLQVAVRRAHRELDALVVEDVVEDRERGFLERDRAPAADRLDLVARREAGLLG